MPPIHWDFPLRGAPPLLCYLLAPTWQGAWEDGVILDALTQGLARNARQLPGCLQSEQEARRVVRKLSVCQCAVRTPVSTPAPQRPGWDLSTPVLPEPGPGPCVPATCLPGPRLSAFRDSCARSFPAPVRVQI